MKDKFKSWIHSHPIRLKTVTNILSSFFIPLMIGVFTVITTIQQQRISDRQQHQEQLQLDDSKKESTFNNYMESISTLLLEDTTHVDIGPYIKAKTLATLR